MDKEYFIPSKNSPERWIILGIPILSIIGCIMHFVYQWSGKLLIIGVFAPVNESVWEHLKMTFWPILIWWFVGYLIYNKKSNMPISKWSISCVISELACILVIISFYYTYTGALGIESLVLDIFSLFLGIALAQVLAFHIYKYAKPSCFSLYISIVLLIFLIIIFTVFTFAPPHIPIFKDSLTQNYGI